MSHLFQFNTIDNIVLPDFKYRQSDKGIRAYVLENSALDIVQIELFFNAGRWFEKKPLAASACTYLMKEGTKTMSAYDLAERIEYFGAGIQTRSGNDFASISLFCLRRFADKLLELLFTILQHASFPQDELSLFVNRKKQSLQADLSKAPVVAYRELTELLYGAHHPYGYNSSTSYYDALRRSDLSEHYKHFKCLPSYIFIAGKVDNSFVQNVLDRCDSLFQGKKMSDNSIKIKPDKTTEKRLKLKQSQQVSLNMGTLLPPLKDESLYDLLITNTLFGGYFGSRLMKSIREEKGYSYGISSFVQRNCHSMDLIITTEVDAAYLDATRRQIDIEMDKLHNEKISDTELTMLKNYLMGSFLQQFNGQIRCLRALKRIILKGDSIHRLSQMLDYLQNINAEQIRQTAQKHLQRKNFTTVIVE